MSKGKKTHLEFGGERWRKERNHEVGWDLGQKERQRGKGDTEGFSMETIYCREFVDKSLLPHVAFCVGLLYHLASVTRHDCSMEDFLPVKQLKTRM